MIRPYVHTTQALIHLENDPREVTIQFYQSKGGDSVNICVRTYLGTRKFCTLDSNNRLLLVHSQIPKNVTFQARNFWILDAF